MVDLLRTQQLDIMLSLGSMCAIIAFFIIMTGMNTKEKKALFIMETGAAILLLSARLTWIYNGQPDDFSKFMSLISNFFDYFGVVIVMFAFNMYLKEMFSRTAGPGHDHIRFKIIELLIAVDGICICLSPFNGMCYRLDEYNVYSRGPAVVVCFAVPLIVHLIMITLIIQYYKRLKRRMRLLMLLFLIVPIPATALQFYFYGLETTNITIVVMAVLLYLFDLSDINKTAIMSEKAIAANEAKSAFLSNMSHEIRTPINAVLGMNEMILRESDDPKILSYSRSIKTASSSLLGIINDILDISKIEAGKIDLIPVDYELSDLIYDLVNMIDTRAEAKGLQFRIDIDPELPKVLNGDEVRIRQVILNILTNAVKYTETGFVLFQMTCDSLSPDSDQVVIKVSVTDTGIGIRQEDMDRLFYKFERIDEKRNRSIEGTGLGLTITKNLLEMMGSSLTVESEYGKGSTFSFLLEQKIISRECLGDYQALYHQYLIQNSKYKERLKAPDAKILIVDDYSMNLEVFRGLVKNTLIQVDTAKGGAEALKLTADKMYDVIFLDHMMPGMDGIETLTVLRSLSSNPNRNTPVICLTANAIYGAKEEYMDAGFNDYLAKPVDPEKLEEMLIKYLPGNKVSIGTEERTETSTSLPDELYALSTRGVIDISAGIKTGGSAANYLEILNMFYASLDDRIEELGGYFSQNDISNYTIKVHALKTGFRTIGAFELGEAAASLELAGKNNDLKYIGSHHEEFLGKVASFKKELSTFMEKENEHKAEDNIKPVDEEILKGFFREIRKAAEEKDCDSLDEILTKIGEYAIPAEYKDLFAKIKEANDNYEYKKVIESLDERDK